MNRQPIMNRPGEAGDDGGSGARAARSEPDIDAKTAVPDEPIAGYGQQQIALAIERTYAAWVRTGLASVASGVAARELIAPAVPPRMAAIMASLLVLFGCFCFVAGVWCELALNRPPLPKHFRLVPPAMLIAANIVMIAVGAMALIGIWYSRS